jgi:molybdopterin/thiamine biosynthesis adenylyltransferase
MDDTQLLRYSRHILLKEFGVEAQEKLLASSALVVGAGGLGSAALMYLASAGIGRIVIADGDKVDLTNLQRQIVHRESTIGVNKAESAALTLGTINPECNIETVPERLKEDALWARIAAIDIVLDCSDNFATRHAINRACVTQRKPLVSGAGIRFDGQITSFDSRRSDSPCYHCLFPEQTEAEEERCAIMGVFAPLVGIIGAMQASEAIRLLADVGEALVGRLLLLDGLTMSWHQVKLLRDQNCPVCGAMNAVAPDSPRSMQYAQV